MSKRNIVVIPLIYTEKPSASLLEKMLTMDVLGNISYRIYS